MSVFKLKKFSLLLLLLLLIVGGLVFCHYKKSRVIPNHAISAKQEQGFDYYLLALSWSPFYCKAHLTDKSQCGQGQTYRFILHGLWPQNNCKNPASCYPSYCSCKRLDESTIREMLPFMVKPKLIKHEWEKHGTCSGLTQEQYFNSARNLFIQIKIPVIFSQTSTSVSLTAKKITELFMQSNPKLNYNSIRLITNKSGELSAIEICFDKSLSSVACPFHGKRTSEQLITVTFPNV